MTFTLDISDDFEEVCADFNGAATLRMAGVDYALTSVLSEPVEWKELDPTNAQVIRNGTLFVWAKKRTPQPTLGSIIIDEDGEYWTIWRALKKQHVDCWEVRCLDLNIVSAPANTATVLKATYTHGTAGEASATWFGLWSGVAGGNSNDTIAARFQPSDETAEIEFGAEYPKQVYRVYFETPVPIELAGGEYRLVDSGGERYRVVRYYDEQRIDKLPVAVAVRITEGSEYWDAFGGSGGSGS